MSRGIAPLLLKAQVENTAAWALGGPASGRDETWRARLRAAEELEARWTTDDGRLDYFGLMLAAHFSTVATFVPTDVDSRIRFHAFQECFSTEALSATVDVIDETDRWDARVVSERVIEIDELGPLSLHDGEWLSVRAGALGRALQLGDGILVERIAERIDQELQRELESFLRVAERRTAELLALKASTIVAHNLGDLSRVVDAWPDRGAAAQQLRARYSRLGHEGHGDGRFGAGFHTLGSINKAITATENNRFLALRAARGLRSQKELLLPIGPLFDEWGATIATTRWLDSRGRLEVLSALLEGHERNPSQSGYLRALAGLHDASQGGLDRLSQELPSKQRKRIFAGPVRGAIGLSRERFEARLIKAYRTEYARAQHGMASGRLLATL